SLGINQQIERFDCSIFDGDYVTGGVDEAYLARIESQRNDAAKSARGSAGDLELMELHSQA
ncbi:MAG: amidophosphoribosyltransferase, partial [Pseudomonadales bacterium]|nr:amidophosphoribosyltransferase [Pseudomonadales bacterium]